MKFEIRRASQSLIDADTESPADGAIRETITHDNGNRSYYWTIEIDTLEELMDFIDREGDIVIEAGWSNWITKQDLLQINIYDDYIE